MRAKPGWMHVCVCWQPGGGGDTGETKKEER